MVETKLSYPPAIDLEGEPTPPVLASQNGFWPVLQNRMFRRLWTAQVLAQTSQYGLHFAQMVLIEYLTGSSIQMGFMIIAFSLPGLIFSPVAGVMADRLPKKYILFGANVSRALFVFSYLLLLAWLPGGQLLIAIYTITFIMAIISQFFAPAETATIPQLVDIDHLMAANSLFGLTSALAQIMGMIILSPLVIKIFGLKVTFVIIGILYLIAAYNIWHIPASQTGGSMTQAVESFRRGWAETWREIQEGWQFIARNRVVMLGIVHMALISALVMILGMLAPGFAVRVLHLAPEDSFVVFVPAGVGMLLMTIIVGRLGNNVPRLFVNTIGILIIGISFFALGWLTDLLSGMKLLTGIAAASFMLGVSMSAVNIIGQTVLQEASPLELHGRVFAVRFMMNNLLGLPPMLIIGIIADLWGIANVMLVLGVILMLFALYTLHDLHRHPLPDIDAHRAP